MHFCENMPFHKTFIKIYALRAYMRAKALTKIPFLCKIMENGRIGCIDGVKGYISYKEMGVAL